MTDYVSLEEGIGYPNASEIQGFFAALRVTT
jgi:hypothetical protein